MKHVYIDCSDITDIITNITIEIDIKAGMLKACGNCHDDYYYYIHGVLDTLENIKYLLEQHENRY